MGLLTPTQLAPLSVTPEDISAGVGHFGGDWKGMPGQTRTINEHECSRFDSSGSRFYSSDSRF